MTINSISISLGNTVKFLIGSDDEILSLGSEKEARFRHTFLAEVVHYAQRSVILNHGELL